MNFDIPDDTKVLVATPNYVNQFEATVHVNHMECSSSWTKWGIDFNWTIIGRSFVHFARTQMCQVAVEGKFTHVLWLDDDAVIDPEILPRFIQHDKDVVIAPYAMRKMPHDIGVLKSDIGDYHNHGSYRNFDMSDMNKGLVEVDGGRTHCMLVKVSALMKRGETVDDHEIPIELEEEIKLLGDRGQMLTRQILGDRNEGAMSFYEEDEIGIPYFVMPKVGTEDMYWCYRAKRKGIRIWCDTDVFAGHMGFVPMITEQWRLAAEDTVKNLDAEGKVLSIIPGTTDLARKPTEIRMDRTANLV